MTKSHVCREKVLSDVSDSGSLVRSFVRSFLPSSNTKGPHVAQDLSQTSNSCHCRSMCRWVSLLREWDQMSREGLSPLITRPIPALKKQDVRNGLSRTFDPACKITATLTLPCWRSVSGPQRHFQWNVISNQWPTHRHAHISDAAGKPYFLKNGQRMDRTDSA